MNNLVNLNEFKKLKNGDKLFEGAIKKDNAFLISIRTEVPTSLVNAYVKKVQQETGKNLKDLYGDQEIAEDILKYAATKFLTVENIPSSLYFGSAEAAPVEVTPEGETEKPVVAEDVPTAEVTTEQTPAAPEQTADTTGNPAATAETVSPTEI